MSLFSIVGTILQVKNPPNSINHRCRFFDHNGQRYIHLNGLLLYTYDLSDKNTERLVWVQMILSGYATPSEIAKHLPFTLRTIQRWKAQFLKGECLDRKSPPGPAIRITASVKKRVLQMIRSGSTHAQITSSLGISGSSIDLIVAEAKKKDADTFLQQ